MLDECCVFLNEVKATYDYISKTFVIYVENMVEDHYGHSKKVIASNIFPPNITLINELTGSQMSFSPLWGDYIKILEDDEQTVYNFFNTTYDYKLKIVFNNKV